MTSIYVGISLGFIMGTGREIFLLQPPPGHLHPVRHGLEAVHCRPHIQLSKPVSAGLQLPVVIVDDVADLPPTPGTSDIRHHGMSHGAMSYLSMIQSCLSKGIS